MKKAKFLVPAIGALLLLLAGCEFVPSTSGTVVVSIKEIAPWVVESMAKGGPDNLEEAEPKAYIRATKVVFDLYQGYSVVGNWVWYPTTTPPSGSGSAVGTCTLSGVEEGAYTTLRVYIYNDAVSSSVPVVAGESGQFSVIAGQTTNIGSIVCFPFDSVQLYDNAYSENFVLGTGKEEQWFKVMTSHAKTKFWINCVSGDLDLYVFYPDGSYAGRLVGSSPIEALQLDTPVHNDFYYVAAYAYTPGTVKVKYSDYLVTSQGSVSVTIQ